MKLLLKVAILSGFCFSFLASGFMAKPVSADVPYTYDLMCIDVNLNHYHCGTFTCGLDYPEGCDPDCPEPQGSCYNTNHRALPVNEDCEPSALPSSYDDSYSYYFSPYLLRIASSNGCQAPLTPTCDYDDSKYPIDKSNRDLNDKHLSPEMVRALKAALAAARQAGIDARVGEAYRSPERADSLYQAYIKTGKYKAAPPWGTAHNYGIGVDVDVYDSAGKIIANNNNGEYTRLAKYMTDEGFTWFGENLKNRGKDDRHFEYHPAITGLMSAAQLKAARDKVINEMGLPDIRCTEWWPQFWDNLQNVVSRQPLSSADNPVGDEASDPGFGIRTNGEQSEQEELREEIEEDVDECDLDPDDPWCASLRGE